MRVFFKELFERSLTKKKIKRTGNNSFKIIHPIKTL